MAGLPDPRSGVRPVRFSGIVPNSRIAEAVPSSSTSFAVPQPAALPLSRCGNPVSYSPGRQGIGPALASPVPCLPRRTDWPSAHPGASLRPVLPPSCPTDPPDGQSGRSVSCRIAAPVPSRSGGRVSALTNRLADEAFRQAAGHCAPHPGGSWTGNAAIREIGFLLLCPPRHPSVRLPPGQPVRHPRGRPGSLTGSPGVSCTVAWRVTPPPALANGAPLGCRDPQSGGQAGQPTDGLGSRWHGSRGDPRSRGLPQSWTRSPAGNRSAKCAVWWTDHRVADPCGSAGPNPSGHSVRDGCLGGSLR